MMSFIIIINTFVFKVLNKKLKLKIEENSF